MPNDELEAPAGERARLFASAEAVSTQEMLALLDQVGLPATEMLAFFDQAGFPATSPEASSEPQRSSELEAQAASEDQADLSGAASEAHNSPLTKSLRSASLARRRRTGVRLWQWGGKESVRAT